MIGIIFEKELKKTLITDSEGFTYINPAMFGVYVGAFSKDVNASEAEDVLV
jgi:hypothetical protein